jgi:hypothetical protein
MGNTRKTHPSPKTAFHSWPAFTSPAIATFWQLRTSVALARLAANAKIVHAMPGPILRPRQLTIIFISSRCFALSLLRLFQLSITSLNLCICGSVADY